MRIGTIVAGFILALLVIAPASANTIKIFELNGVKFADGQTATGQFTFDLSTNKLLSSSIVTSARPFSFLFVGGNYDGSPFDTVFSSTTVFTDWAIFPITGQLLSLKFNLADLSMSSFVARGNESIWSAFCLGQCASRKIVAGTINAVATTPIPAALPLLMTALGGIGFMGWRRKRQQAAA